MCLKFLKVALWGTALLPFIMGAIAKQEESKSWTLIIGGNTAGYLSPCGCTKPMAGGIRRRATKTEELAQQASFIIETGPIVGVPGRQSELKAETLAESLKAMKVDVLALTSKDLILGEPGIAAVERLSNTSILGTENSSVFVNSKCAVYADGTSPSFTQLNAISRARELVQTAKERSVPSIYVTTFDREMAMQIAEAVPQLDVIIYASKSAPRNGEDRVGKTWLLTPGPQGQYVTSITFSGDGFESPVINSLGPDVHDHTDVSRYYSRYLDRVRNEKLVEMMPKVSDAVYAGTEACRSCHEAEYKIWKGSKHAQAFATLESDKHDADPDCVSCHVVGIESTNGFIVKEKTPQFTDVGCESCHGAGQNHTLKPKEAKMPTLGTEACAKCHNLQHSPTFDFSKYWEKIKH